MKKAVPLLITYYLNFVVLLVLFLFLYFNIDKQNSDDMFSLLLIVLYALWFLAFVGSLIRLIAGSVKELRNNDIKPLMASVKFLKLGSIPYFIVNFALCAMIGLLFVLVSRGLGLIFLPIPVVLTWLTMLSTSISSFFLLAALRKNKAATTGFIVKHIILQLFFIIDIIGALFIVKRANAFLAKSPEA